MPELAEAEFFRKRWHQAAVGQRVANVLLHDRAKVFRKTDAKTVLSSLKGARYLNSEAATKQILFQFQKKSVGERRPSGVVWLGVHLGMSGELRVGSPDYTPQRHDHLVLQIKRSALIFSDTRMFGRVQVHVGSDAPGWWTHIAPPIVSAAFTVEAVGAFLKRRARAPIKAVMLMQERFPGIGNWMADEILWRAAIHPRRLAGSLRPAEVRRLWIECRRVCRLALATIAGRGDDLPLDLNVRIPDTWLFNHRWEPGGRCPKTKQPLARAEIGGRTTCWSPARQKYR